MDPRQQRYPQLKQKICDLRYTLEQEIYLLRGYRNFVVETNIKYLARMLINQEKIYNMIINCQVNYIRTNLFFEITNKKEKTFELDGLLRRKQYPGNLSLDRFENGLDDEKSDIPILLKKYQEEIFLKLEEFYKDINLQEDFFYEKFVEDMVY